MSKRFIAGMVVSALIAEEKIDKKLFKTGHMLSATMLSVDEDKMTITAAFHYAFDEQPAWLPRCR